MHRIEWCQIRGKIAVINRGFCVAFCQSFLFIDNANELTR